MDMDPPDHTPTPAELDRFRQIIRQQTGLHFDDWRLDTLERALAARISATGLRPVSAYLGELECSEQRFEEISALLDQITVNETCFFRYPRQYDFLRDVAFLPLLRRDFIGPLRIWSAGCSSGEEAYSIAITALETLGPSADQLVQIIASDVSSTALDAARRAEYSPKSLRLVGGGWQGKYFHPAAENRFLLCDQVRRMVLFRKSHLLDDVRQGHNLWDLIFCRNVLIYFAPDVVRCILDGFCQSLKENGCLLVGHSEVVEHRSLMPCQPAETFAYRKVGRQASAGDGRPQGVTPTVMPPPRSHPAGEPPCVGPEGLFEVALAAFEHEEYLSAAHHLDSLLGSRPRDLRATLLRANLYLNLGHHDQSVRECEVALQIDGFSAEACLLLGMNFMRLAKPELAVTQLRKAAYIAPRSCAIQFHLGDAYRAAKMPRLAMRAYGNALSLAPSATEQEIRDYFGGFGKSTLETLCRQRVCLCEAADNLEA
jgi:chemotaxis protein methyltransferase CheR